jgi:hypothetical protein
LLRPEDFGKKVGFNDLTALHGDWMRKMLAGSDDMTILAHRGSYKTTCLSIVIACMLVLYPKKNIIFFRKSGNDVIEVVRQVRHIMEHDVMKYLSGCVYQAYGKLRPVWLVEDAAYKLTTSAYASPRGASQLLGIGTIGSITGKHADIVITDDIVNLKDRVSKAERDRIKTVYQELQNIKNREGRIINAGTPWHKEDAISLMPNVVKYDCYQTGLIGAEALQVIRGSMTPSLFAANYELVHIAASDMLFDAPKFTKDEESIYDGIGHIDAAYGGADGTAFTAMRKRPDGRFTGFGKLWHKHVDDCLTDILMLKERYHVGTTYCEDNADKGYLKKELRKRGDTVQGYHESTNKYVKIATYLKSVWQLIDWLPETDPEYLNEILDYTENAEHDDAPDSAASIMRKLYSRQTNAAAQPETSRYGGIL